MQKILLPDLANCFLVRDKQELMDLMTYKVTILFVKDPADIDAISFELGTWGFNVIGFDPFIVWPKTFFPNTVITVPASNCTGYRIGADQSVFWGFTSIPNTSQGQGRPAHPEAVWGPDRVLLPGYLYVPTKDDLPRFLGRDQETAKHVTL